MPAARLQLSVFSITVDPRIWRGGRDSVVGEWEGEEGDFCEIEGEVEEVGKAGSRFLVF
jgi:hypothetical protein